MKKSLTTISLIAASLFLAGSALAQTVVFPSAAGNAHDLNSHDARRAKVLIKYDADSNGVLDRDERLALRVDAISGDLPMPRWVSPEAREFRATLQHDYDVDEDGSLDQWERLVLRWDLDSGVVSVPWRAGRAQVATTSS